MNSRHLVVLVILSAITNCAADRRIELVRTEGWLYGFHNPAYKGHVSFCSDFDGKDRVLVWTLRKNDTPYSQCYMTFFRNNVSLLRNNLLNNVSLHVAGGIAHDAFKEPHGQLRKFDYRPVSRFLVLRNFTNKSVSEGKSADDILEQILPREIQDLTSVGEVMDYFKDHPEPIFVLDLLSALTVTNEKWQEDLPVRQVPRILTFWEKFCLSALPFLNLKKAELENHYEISTENSDAERCAAS